MLTEYLSAYSGQQEWSFPESVLPVPIFLFSPIFFVNNFAGYIHLQWAETIDPKETY